MSILKEIEKNPTIFELKYKGESIWPIFRLKSFYQHRSTVNKTVNRTRKLNFNSVWVIIKSFFYGIRSLFQLHSYEFLVFSGSERRKRNQGLYHERVVEGLLGSTNSLLIENPFPLGKHFPKDEIPTKHIMSETILYVGVFILGLFYYKKNKVENEHIIKEIMEKYGFTINYHRFLLIFEGQYRIIKLLFSNSRKPKAVFFVYSGSSMGYIKAFKEMGIPVIEVQHGIINEKHNAYNVYNDFGKGLFPDYLLTYGKRELEVFQNPNNYFIDPKHVIPVGYYLLDKYLTQKPEEYLGYIKNLQKKYTKIVVFTHQEIFEKEILDFLISSARLNNNILFLLIPRNNLKDQRQDMPDNLIVEKALNIYDCLQFADIHSTISSTCAIESICFGVPNIMYDYQNRAKSYYGGILKDDKHTIFVETPKEFIDMILNHRFENKDDIITASDIFFKQNSQHNIVNFLENVIKG